MIKLVCVVNATKNTYGLTIQAGSVKTAIERAKKMTGGGEGLTFYPAPSPE